MFLLAMGVAVGAGMAWKPVRIKYGLAAARQALLQRDYEAALAQLQAADRMRPRDPEIHFLLARVFRHLGQAARCRDHLDNAREFGADPGRLEREQWLLLAQLGRLREAEPHVVELLEGAADEQREACEAFVRGYLANLRLGEAQALLAGWTQDFPNDPEAWRLQGAKHELTSSFSEAAEAYRRAAELAPARLDCKLRLSAMLVELRRLEENHELLRRCLDEHPHHPAVLVAWSKSLQSQGKLDQAEQSLRKLLEISPEHEEGRILLAEIRLALQDYKEAVRLLTGVVERRPHQTAARYLLARALTACGRAAEAKPHWEFVAHAQEATEKLDDMIARAVERPDDAALRFEIGSTLWKYGSPDDAARWMRSVLELAPDHRGARQMLGEYLKQRGPSSADTRLVQESHP